MAEWKGVEKLANTIEGSATKHPGGPSMEKILRERLEPLLEAADSLMPMMWEETFLAKDCEHTDWTRAVVKLRKVLSTWR